MSAGDALTDNDFGWGELARGGVEVRVVPGAHETILETPNVESLAKELRDCLTEARSASSALIPALG